MNLRDAETEAGQAFDEAKASTDEAIPFDEAIKQIEQFRKLRERMMSEGKNLADEDVFNVVS